MCRECQSYPCTLVLNVEVGSTFECNCSPSTEVTNIGTSDVVAGLLKYNSGLTKYLHKYQEVPITKNSVNEERRPENSNKEPDARSIVEIYNLKYLPPQQTIPPSPLTKQFEEAKSKVPSSEPEPSPSPNLIPSPTSLPEKPANKAKPQPGSNEAKIAEHMKEVSLNSRYLSNTGFKKYFNREIFENYGRENRTHVADGFIYNNYMKTFNINPHCGGNIPITQETHRHSLVTGDNRKYGNEKVPTTHYGNEQDKEALDGYHRKPIVEMEGIVEDSKKFHENQEKYTRKLDVHHEPNAHSHEYRTQVMINHMNGNGDECRGKSNTVQMRQVSMDNHRRETNRQLNSQHEQIRKIEENTGFEEPLRKNNKTNIQENEYQFNEQLGREHNRISNDKNHSYANYPEPQPFIPSVRQEERWEDDECDVDRIELKKQILRNCYTNSQIKHEIEGKQKPPCSLCAGRKYSKCCCMA